jgi:hypothetical protein
MLGLTPRVAQMTTEHDPARYVMRICDDVIHANDALARSLCDLVQKGLARNPAYQYAIELGQLAPLRVDSIDRAEADLCVAHYLSKGGRCRAPFGDVKMPSLAPSDR